MSTLHLSNTRWSISTDAPVPSSTSIFPETAFSSSRRSIGCTANLANVRLPFASWPGLTTIVESTTLANGVSDDGRTRTSDPRPVPA